MSPLKWIAVLAVTLFFGPVFGQTNSLPKPTGKYFVGVTYLSFTDEKRTELFDNDQKSKREITVKAWYPADIKSSSEPYLRHTEFALTYCQFPETIRNLTTNSALNVPVSLNADYSLYPSPQVSFLLWTIDGKRALDIPNILVLSFFEKYLKNIKEINLLAEAAKFPAIETASNLMGEESRTQTAGTEERGVNLLEEVNLGGIKQWILARGESSSFPILLFLHGGPGFPEMPFTHIDSQLLEKHFIVVNWDQRGAGKTAAAGTPPEIMNTDQYLADTHELVELLKTRFKKKKIFLLGHSWGSIIGLLTAYRYPESIHAYIGMGQVVNMQKSEALSYSYALAKARELKDEKAVKQLVQIGPPDTWQDYTSLEIQRTLLDKYKGVFNKLSYAEIGRFWFTSPYYTQAEKQSLMISFARTQKIMRPKYMQVDLEREVHEVKVPVYFLVGRSDHVTHGSLVEDYFKALKAPRKELIWFEESGHHPNLEEPEKYQKTLINKILENTLNK
jgi:pimeloyl-ACP methyl ester carboxylesterase